MIKIYFTIFAFFIVSLTRSQVSIDLESGVATFGYNDVSIPGKTGTLFSLSDNVKNDFSAFFRARLQFGIGKRHNISALYAPFTVKNKTVYTRDISFQNELFTAGDPIHFIWKFNSYRLSYQYSIIARERLILALGLTANVRDAKIELTNTTISAVKTNIGFVPLIRFYADLKVAEKFHFIVDGDALVAKQGRAEDVLFAVGYHPWKRLRIKLGYRILEGGADNDEVYNFSAVHYAVGGIVLTL